MSFRLQTVAPLAASLLLVACGGGGSSSGTSGGDGTIGGDGATAGTATGGTTGTTTNGATTGSGTTGATTNGGTTDGTTNSGATDSGATDSGATDGGTGTPTPPPITVIDFLPQKRGLLPSIARADGAFSGDHHSGSQVCSSCHNDPGMQVPTDTGTPKDVSIGTAWQTSTMANAARDPYWHAVVASEIDDFPMLEDLINDKCTRCHAPMANDLAKKTGLDFRLFDKVVDGQTLPGIYSASSRKPVDGQPEVAETDINRLFDHAMDGVSCSLCHQIDPNNLGTEESMTGGFVVVDQGGGDKPAYGQYADSPVAYMLANSGFAPQEGLHLSSSESCATCHNLNVEPVNAAGEKLEGVGHFAEQASYTEWLYSDYADGRPLAASCQSCHMPKLDKPVRIAGAGADVARPDFAEHTFLAANTVMQTMMRDFADELGIPKALDADGNRTLPLDFDASIARNREFLRSAATVSMQDIVRTPAADTDEASGDAGARETLSFDVKVVNETGHKLPSGYHSRRAYLHVLVTGEQGVVWESGDIDAAGRITGLSEDVDPDSWEIHYDRITKPSQVQVYQSVVGDENGARTQSLLSGSHFLKDNRIVPKGYDKNAVAADPDKAESFGTFGAAMTDDDFNLGSDTVTYEIQVPAGGDYRVLAELRYQPLAYGHLQKLFLKSARLDVMDMFRTIYDATDLRDEVIATVVEDVPVN